MANKKRKREEGYTTIRISKSVKERIDNESKKSESYDDILLRLLEK